MYSTDSNLRPIQTEGGRAAHAGAIIQTMSSFSGRLDRTHNRVRLLSQSPLYKFIVLIMAVSWNGMRAARPPARLLFE